MKQSRFMVADFTGNSYNVYYEVGYAMGFNIPVIFTCKKNWYQKKVKYEFNKEIKFDIRQYPFIVYKNYNKLKIELIDKIRALIL